MHCPHCDHQIAADASACTRCGTTIAPAAVQHAAPPQSTPQLMTPPAAPAMAAAAPVPAQTVNVAVQVAPVAPVVVLANQAAGPGCLVRGLYFLFVGWWLSQLWIFAAWFLNATVIGLPLGLTMLNRLPQVVTLKAAGTHTSVTLQGGAVVVQQGGLPQRGFLLRAAYFLIIGWWFSLIWVQLAWLGCVSLLGLPLAFWMFDRTPAVTTLARH